MTAKVRCYKGGVMPFDANARLKIYMERIIDRTCTEPEILEILRLTRHVIEKDRSRTEFPHLSLYSDWVQHIEIDRHPQGVAIIEFMNDIVIRHWSDSSGLVEEVSRAFGLALLRQEMLLLIVSKGVSTAIVDSLSNWRTFVGILLNEVCHKPIRLTNALKPAHRRNIFDRMQARWKGAGIDGVGPPRALSIEAQAEDTDGAPPGYYWIIEICAKLTGNDFFNLREVFTSRNRQKIFYDGRAYAGPSLDHASSGLLTAPV